MKGLIHNLEATCWTDGRGNELSPLEAIQTGHPGHMAKIQAADPKYPILVNPDGWIADGVHRLAQAHLAGRTHVPVRQFAKMPADAIDQGREDLQRSEAGATRVLRKEAFAPGVGNLPEAGKGVHRRPHVVDPVGTQIDGSPGGTEDTGKFKTQGSDGKTKWRHGRAGLVLGADGAPRSSLSITKK